MTYQLSVKLALSCSPVEMFVVPGELGLKLALMGLSHALTGGGGAGPVESDI